MPDHSGERRKSAAAGLVAVQNRRTLPAMQDSRIRTDTVDDGLPARFRRVVSFHPRGGRLNAVRLEVLPDDRLPINRTGSSGSKVGPLVTSALRPARSRPC